MLKKSKLYLLLLATPLLMANSPAPNSYPDRYGNYELSIISSTYDPLLHSYYSTIEIKNTGDGYIDLCNSYFKYNFSLSYEDYFLMVEPHSSLQLNILSEEEIDPYYDDFVCYGYTDFSKTDITLNSFTEFEKRSNSIYNPDDIPTSTYTYSTTLDFSWNVSQRYRSAIVTVEYEGVTSSFYVYSLYNGFSFSSNLNLLASKIKVKEIVSIHSNYHNYKANNEVLNYILTGLIIVGIVILASPLVGGLVVATIFIIKGIKRKKRLAKAKASDQPSNKEK